MMSRMIGRSLSVLCLLGVLSVGLGADTRAIMSLVGATDSSLNLKVLAVATSGVAGDTRAIGSLVGTTDSAGNLKVTLDAASVISGANFLANTSGTCVTPRYSYTGDTDTGVGYLGANNIGLCANGATIIDVNASRVLFAQPIYGADGTAVAPTLAKGSNPTTGLWFSATNAMRYSALGVDTIQMDANRVALSSGMALSWGDGTTITGTGSYDVNLFRDVANTLAQRNGVNAQTFNLYNTFTSATNYERVGFNWSQSANRFRIESVKGSGGGTARPIDFTDGATAILTIDPVTASMQTRILGATLDNTFDLGAVASTRFRTGYFGTSVVSPVLSFPSSSSTISLSGGPTLTFRSDTQTGGELGINYTAINNTSAYWPAHSEISSFVPASGSGSWAALELRPTINGVSSGKAAALGIASLTNTLTGGTMYLIDAGTTTTDWVTGYTRLFSVDTAGLVAAPVINATTGVRINGAATSGASLIGNGTNFVSLTPAWATANPANQTANATATLKMNGLGAAGAPCTITPIATGRVRFAIYGTIANTLTGDGVTYKLAYGTGTAPANSAAATGTILGVQQTWTALTGELNTLFHIEGVATGLALSTATWFDLQLADVTGGSASATNVVCVATEG